MVWAPHPQPAFCELGDNALGRVRELIAAQRLTIGEPFGQQQRLGELGFLHLDAEHADAVTETPTVAAFLERCWRAYEHSL